MSNTHDDDLTLLRQYRQRGDQQAFSQLVERHLQSVYGNAFRDLGNVHDAEDVCQKVFTKLAQKGRYARIRSLSGWLFTLTRQEVLDMKRSEGRRRVRETVAAEDPTLVRSECAEIFDGEPNPLVQEAFNLLKEPEQKALFLRFHEELDFKQMGAALGVSQRAAQKRLYRAMDRLKVLLTKRGVTASSAVVVSSLFTSKSMAAPAPNLGARVTQQALVDAAATPLPSAVSIWLMQPATWAASVALLVTVGLVTAGVASKRHQGAAEEAAVEGAPVRESILAGSQRAPLQGFAIDDLEAIYQLPQGEKEDALARLEAHLETQNDGAYLGDLYRRWVDLDAPRSAHSLFSLFGRYREDRERDALLGNILEIPLEVWLGQDAEALREWTRALPRSRAESLTFNAVMKALGPHDPQQAFGLLEQRGASDDHPYQILADALAERGVGFTCDFLHALPTSEANEVTSSMNAEVTLQGDGLDPRTRLFAAVVPNLFAEAPQEVADWIVGLPDNKEANAFTTAFVEQWAAMVPEDAASWAKDLGPETREAVAPTLLAAWSRHDAEAAIQWAFEEGGLSEPYQAMKGGFAGWVSESSSRSQALQWLETQVSESNATPLFGLASEAMGAEVALEWVKPLVHGDSRQCAIDHAFFSYGLRDPNEGMVQLDSIQPVAARRAAALAFAEAMFIGQGREAVTRLREQAYDNDEELLAQAAYEAQVGILASLNPELIAEEVLVLPSGVAKGQLLSTLLDRTYRRSAAHAEDALTWTSQLQSRALRGEWEARVKQTLTDAPWRHAAALPERLKAGFKTQSLADFRERLDLLSRLPPLSK